MSPSERLTLHWHGHEQAFVHAKSGATLEGLQYAAKQAGYAWHIEYPEGPEARRCIFVVGRSYGPKLPARLAAARASRKDWKHRR